MSKGQANVNKKVLEILKKERNTSLKNLYRKLRERVSEGNKLDTEVMIREAVYTLNDLGLIDYGCGRVRFVG